MNRLYLRNNDKRKLRANETRLRSLARSKSASCFVKRAVFWTKMGGLKICCLVRQLSRIDAVKTKKKVCAEECFFIFFIFYFLSPRCWRLRVFIEECKRNLCACLYSFLPLCCLFVPSKRRCPRKSARPIFPSSMPLAQAAHARSLAPRTVFCVLRVLCIAMPATVATTHNPSHLPFHLRSLSLSYK